MKKWLAWHCTRFCWYLTYYEGGQTSLSTYVVASVDRKQKPLVWLRLDPDDFDGISFGPYPSVRAAKNDLYTTCKERFLD